MKAKAKRKPRRLFSGKSSEMLWRLINRVPWETDIGKALYALGCDCQELESRVEHLENARLRAL